MYSYFTYSHFTRSRGDSAATEADGMSENEETRWQPDIVNGYTAIDAAAATYKQLMGQNKMVFSSPFDAARARDKSQML